MTAQSFAPSNTGPQLRATNRFERVVAATSFFLSGLLLWFRELRQLSDIWFMPDLKGYPQFYRDQAESMLNGGFAVPPESLGDECYTVGDNCVGYFGVTPSFVRAPFLALTSGDMSPLAAFAGFLLNVGSALLLLLVVWKLLSSLGLNTTRPAARLLFFLVAFGLGPGSLALMVTYPDVGNEAILWGSGFLLLQMLLIFAWCQNRNWVLLALSLPAGVLAALSRPPMMVSASVLSLIALYLAYRAHLGSRQKVTAGLGVLLPAATSLGVFYLKFGQFLPDVRRNVFISSSPYWKAIFEANGGHFTGWMFVPTNLWNFLRPDAVSYQLLYPRGATFTPVDYVWPVSEGMMYADPSASLTNLVPGPLFLTLILMCCGLLVGFTGLKRLYRLLLGLTLAAASGLAMTLGQLAMTNRYLVDAWPALVVGAVGGAGVTLYLLRARPLVGRLLVAVTLVLIPVGVLTELVVMR